jgi:2-oxoglutarate ferredoxin oxidoreductase subunit delta
LCVHACPQEVLEIASDRLTPKGFHPARLKSDGCTGCAICAIVCPEAAITVYRAVQPRPVPAAG